MTFMESSLGAERVAAGLDRRAPAMLVCRSSRPGEACMADDEQLAILEAVSTSIEG